jgi:hypothetical protein
VDKAQRTLLAVCFLVLLGGGLWSRLTPVEVGGTDCADPPTELTSECFDAQGDRSRVQIAVSGTLLTGTYVSVRLIGRRSRTGAGSDRRYEGSGGQHVSISATSAAR